MSDNIYNPSNRSTLITSGSGNVPNLQQSDLSRILPRQLSTGSTRGVQKVGYGNTNIDGSNNTITLGSGIILDGTNETITVENAGVPIITTGKDSRGEFNFRIVDNNGIGIGQFGQFPDGKIALRTAKDGIEVATSTLAQRTFDSSSSFTVLLGDTHIFPSMSVASGVTAYATSIVVPHNAGYIPAVGCFGPLEVGGASLPVYPPDFPTTAYTFIANGGLIYQSNLLFMAVYYAVTATDLYLGMSYINDDSSTQILLGAPVTYYVYTYNGS